VAALWSKGNRSIAGSIGGISSDSTGQFMLTYSDDGGEHWVKPYSITPQIKNPSWKILFQGPGSGICMKDGTLVFPAQFWDSTKMPYATIVYSKDHGKTWHCEGVGAKSNTTESQVVELPNGNLMLNMRDNRGGYRSVATTNDLGKTWMTHSTSFNTLMDPVCQASLIRTKLKIKGKLRDALVFSNPNDAKDRKNITIKVSLDNGLSWPKDLQFLVHTDESYGYSSLVAIDQNTIGILYEGVKDLYFAKISYK
jgi:sialidase-1